MNISLEYYGQNSTISRRPTNCHVGLLQLANTHSKHIADALDTRPYQQEAAASCTLVCFHCLTLWPNGKIQKVWIGFIGGFINKLYIIYLITAYILLGYSYMLCKTCTQLSPLSVDSGFLSESVKSLHATIYPQVTLSAM